MTGKQIAKDGISSLQNCNNKVSAEISKATVIASYTKKFQPAIKPKASSTQCPASLMNPPLIGMYVVISAMQLLTRATIMLCMRKLMSRPAGPPL